VGIGGEVDLRHDQLAARLIRAGELEISGEDQAETDSYFDTGRFRFHGPDVFEVDYAGLTNYFKSIRAAFDDRAIRLGIIVTEGALRSGCGPTTGVFSDNLELCGNSADRSKEHRPTLSQSEHLAHAAGELV
jgi:hypothetical protein